MHIIVLSAPNAGEGTLQRSKGQPYQVGFGRAVPPAQQQIPLHQLTWRKTANGDYASSISVRSTNAKSLRVGLKLNTDVDGLALLFGDVNGKSEVPAKQLTTGDIYWSPIVAGDTAVIELRSKSLPSKSVVLEIPTVSHIP